MEMKRVALVLADISGYTRFLKAHTMSMLHAESIITDLLEAVLDHTEHPLILIKLEGDAVFLYAPLEDDPAGAGRDILRQVTAFFQAFEAKEHALIACDACQCEACSNISHLKLKAFLHVGQAAIKTIRQFQELGGEDAILIHRLLKNTIPANEYIVLTQAFFELSGGLAGRTPETRVEECEGIGPVAIQVYYPIGQAPLPARPDPGPPMPGTEQGALADRWNRYAVRRILGREQRRDFSHLPDLKLNPLSLVSYFAMGVGSNIASGLRQRLRPKAKN